MPHTSKEEYESLLCRHDGGLDYRNAWKTDQEADSPGAAERERE